MSKYTTEFKKCRLVYTDEKLFRWIKILWLERRRRKTTNKRLKMGVMQVYHNKEFITLKEYEKVKQNE